MTESELSPGRLTFAASLPDEPVSPWCRRSLRLATIWFAFLTIAVALLWPASYVYEMGVQVLTPTHTIKLVVYRGHLLVRRVTDGAGEPPFPTAEEAFAALPKQVEDDLSDYVERPADTAARPSSARPWSVDVRTDKIAVPWPAKWQLRLVDAKSVVNYGPFQFAEVTDTLAAATWKQICLHERKAIGEAVRSDASRSTDPRTATSDRAATRRRDRHG